MSHDLRTPLRGIDGYSRLLLEDFSAQLGADGTFYLSNIRTAAQQMGQLIYDMAQLASVTRQAMQYTDVDLTALVNRVSAELQRQQPERQVDWRVQPERWVRGDARLLEMALQNLLTNAWKFTRRVSSARIEIGALRQAEQVVYYVQDNGVGFDMAYLDKLFVPFERLHRVEDYEGTGMGLATVRRIILRHGGTVWTEGKEGEEAIFYFTVKEHA